MERDKKYTNQYAGRVEFMKVVQDYGKFKGF